MAYNPSMAMAAPPRPQAYAAQAPPHAVPAAPPGTFAPGTKIQVGGHKVIIQKYFSEGGFAHVYLVKMPDPKDGTDIAILKRVAVPDKDSLANMRTEVETMKKLKGHRPIVTYYDSHASQLKGGGYEVFLLMEFCNGGGLIDFMNTRLQNRLTEPEILKIFSDVTEGVACMHYLKPPLLHRDLKVENVLISKTANGRRYKLCDFGSTAPPRPAATTAAECRLIEDDVQKHTTLQYRSPEMIDVYRKQAIDEKSDIWALGVLLYKLCYYTTPFEEQGQLAILNASFKYPAYPVFSDRLKMLIATMLRENPNQRPNVYQVLREACMMQGIEVPIKDIYSGRTESEARRNKTLPSVPSKASSSPSVGAVFSPPVQQKPVIPDVVPMRRGRPSTTPQPPASKPSPSPMRVTSSDPFAALDSKSFPTEHDEISSRFPSLDQFSLLHEKGTKFEFDNASPTTSKPKDLSQRVTEKLADDAFATPAPHVIPIASPQVRPSTSAMSRAQKIISSTPELQATISAPSPAPLPAAGSYRPTSSYVSQGTMTSPSPPSAEFQQQHQQQLPPIHRFPSADRHRSSSVPRTHVSSEVDTPNPSILTESPRPTSVSRNRSFQLLAAADKFVSSRHSLESGRPSPNAIEPIPRTKSTDPRPRPASAYLESHMDYLREKESSYSQPSKPNFLTKSLPHPKPTSVTPPLPSPSPPLSDSDAAIASNVEFLRQMEDADSVHKTRRSVSGHKHSKRSSMPSISLAGTKSLFAGKFGDAFKRFEHNAATPAPARTPSPPQDMDRARIVLTPIAGSEATDERSDDGRDGDANVEAMTGEQRREMERRRLAEEEARVAQAAREYRERLDAGGGVPPRSIGGVTRASTIQKKVRSLLEENERPMEVRRTAEGYGRFTDAGPQEAPVVPRKNVVLAGRTGQAQGQGRPSAPPKPVHLLTGQSASGKRLATGNPYGGPQGVQGGQVPPPSPPKRAAELRMDMSAREREDYLQDFSRRFPSLSGIEMVETVVGVGRGHGEGLRSRDV